MVVKTIPPTADSEVKVDVSHPLRPIRVPHPKQGRRPAWLLRMSVESVLIIISILAALAVDNLRDNAANNRLAVRSLQIFRREIRQNLARLDDVAPYHDGLRTVVTQAHASPSADVDIRSIAEGLQPTVLLNTAWETALATGALTHIDVEIVSALSLTYSIQQRFVDDNRAQLPRPLAHGASAPEQSRSALEETYAYLNQLVVAEQELRGVYEQALKILDTTLGNKILRSSASDTADLVN